MPLEETGLTRRGLSMKQDAPEETGFRFEIGSRVAREWADEQKIPHRTEGVVINRHRVGNGVEVYEFRPDGFDSLTISEQGHNLVPVHRNAGVGGKNLKKK